MIALVAAGTLNSSAANFKTAVKGVLSGTLSFIWQLRVRRQRDLKGNLRHGGVGLGRQPSPT